MWQYPRMAEGEALWIMKKLANQIEKDFYGELPETNKSIKETYWHENECAECEACLLVRCPRLRRKPQPNRIRGRDGYNVNNLQNIDWVLLDENGHVFHIK